jgi:hypothetical protein
LPKCHIAPAGVPKPSYDPSVALLAEPPPLPPLVREGNQLVEYDDEEDDGDDDEADGESGRQEAGQIDQRVPDAVQDGSGVGRELEPMTDDQLGSNGSDSNSGGENSGASDTPQDISSTAGGGGVLTPARRGTSHSASGAHSGGAAAGSVEEPASSGGTASEHGLHDVPGSDGEADANYTRRANARVLPANRQHFSPDVVGDVDGLQMRSTVHPGGDESARAENLQLPAAGSSSEERDGAISASLHAVRMASSAAAAGAANSSSALEPSHNSSGQTSRAQHRPRARSQVKADGTSQSALSADDAARNSVLKRI